MIHNLLNYARGGLLTHVPPAQPLMWLFITIHIFLVELGLLEMCIRWESLARGGSGESPEPRNNGMLVPEALMGPQRQRVDTVVGAAATLAALQVSQKLRALLGPLGCKTILDSLPK